MSKALLDPKMRCLPLKKLALTLVMATRKFRYYFQTHPITVLMDQPLKLILRKVDLSGRIAKWAVELGKHNIHYTPHTAIKVQVLADFIAEFTQGRPLHPEEKPSIEGQVHSWRLWVDGSSNSKGSKIGVLLVSPGIVVTEQAIQLCFKTSNNEAKYETLISGLKLANVREPWS